MWRNEERGAANLSPDDIGQSEILLVIVVLTLIAGSLSRVEVDCFRHNHGILLLKI